MILQLNPTILVDIPIGRGHTIFIIDYGMPQNSCWGYDGKKWHCKTF